ncbi:hypothetical protein D8674_026746 [Pyrus ussuriensis x Pyrus communis]|uniref:Uncharacterized protein n=1 Tax=Pyrus ussuriensis x Pyrus communis TaxID=2448454 RepID=A0A5N5ICG9_9ROSA|nr:hypothetical protein D8674_026746 [Pyrus ussuriensis x Pyrus communis]
MADSGGPSSKRVQGEGFEKAKSRYQITYTKLIGYQKSDMVNKFRGDVGVLVCDRCGCNYTLDDTNEELMKLMEEALKKGYKQWCYDVERNGGPAE